ncbi:MAG: ABC transporter permease subunit [Gammaproteobacteria bacterium]|nr:MAG: ABC transporter permease subunit [Gammaproteobacteria bacterium]
MFAKPVFLITDVLIFVLVFVIFAFFMYAMRKPHLRKPWRQVVRSKAGVISMIVLLVYISIGILDSMHFHPKVENSSADMETQYSGEIQSVFDLIVADIRNSTEKTYSAPFAAYLFAKETVQLEDGTKMREYPRLTWGGVHLENPEQEKSADILRLAVAGIVKAFVVWLVLMVLLCLIMSVRTKKLFSTVIKNISCGESDIPWRTIAATLAALLAILLVGAEWATKYHVLGTDKVGEDVLYQALKSIRTGVVIGTLTTLLMLPFAITLGIMAGYFRGWIDDVIQYLYTTLNSIPGVLLIAAAVLMLNVYMGKHAEEFASLTQRADLRLLFLCLILGLTSWTGLCRLLRAETLKLREVDFVQAASAFGVGPAQTIFRHILPNMMHIVLITIVLDFSGLVLAEAVLSYINIGVDPTMNSWGNMINSARLEMAREPVVWWSLAASLFFMFTMVLFANLFADVVRDALDPRIAKS